jgi:hypothetical protein
MMTCCTLDSSIINLTYSEQQVFFSYKTLVENELQKMSLEFLSEKSILLLYLSA